jgi:lysophospholipase L1-like esterase
MFETLKGKTINFLGDSITQGVGVYSADDIYLNVMKRNYDIGLCRNYGISGTRIARQQKPSAIAAYDKYYASRVDNMEEADIIVVFGGTNDFGHGDAPFGKMGDTTPDTFYGAMDNLIKVLKNRFGDSKLLFMTPIHRLNDSSNQGEGGKPSGSPCLIQYANAMLEVCEHYSIPCLDMLKAWDCDASSTDIRAKYLPDGLHPNAEGNKIIADILGKWMLSLEKI